MFDTHCHLNFSRFKNKVDEVVDRAKAAVVTYFVVPGTDIETSKKAVEIANNYENIYAAVGIHPHHVYEYVDVTGPAGSFPPASARSNVPLRAVGNPSTSATHRHNSQNFFVSSSIEELKKLLKHKKIVAIGEIGLDRYSYQDTKYKSYTIDEKFIKLQKELFRQQIKLAIEFDKTLILHNREAKSDFLQVLEEVWDKKLEGRTVFHCCEPDDELLEYAIKHDIYLGVDGDITYNKQKQGFIKKIPLDHLVLETDSPFLLPEPLRTQKLFPNEPKNLKLIAEFIAKILAASIDRLTDKTSENANKLFKLEKYK